MGWVSNRSSQAVRGVGDGKVTLGGARAKKAWRSSDVEIHHPCMSVVHSKERECGHLGLPGAEGVRLSKRGID